MDKEYSLEEMQAMSEDELRAYFLSHQYNKMIASLESTIETTKSTRACNALAQLHHAAACDKNLGDEALIEGKKREASRFYQLSAD